MSQSLLLCCVFLPPTTVQELASHLPGHFGEVQFGYCIGVERFI